MHAGRTIRLVIGASALVVATGLALVGPVAGSVAGSGAKPSGTVTFAEAPGANPNYIFPYMGCAYSSVNNINQFQMLMYRPLYWFGLAASTDVVAKLSLANAPVFSNGNRTVTIKLKGWKFANGQTVNARSVMFFLNMYKADPTSYCGYNVGYGIPDQVKAASGAGNSVRMDFTAPVNPNWILYNYLSEITPMPDSWDRTSASQPSACASGPYGAAATATACKAVETYLNSLSLDRTTFTHGLWQGGVDGPWRLTSFDAAGNATFQPNAHYSGPQKAQVRMVKELAYATTVAEQNDLRTGKLTIGYLDPGTLTSPAPTPGTLGPNWGPLVGRYSMVAGSPWSFNYAAFNFSTADPKSAAISQLYVRQALQESVNQIGIIQSVFKGYGAPIYSPIPPHARTSLSAVIANPYPFNLINAMALLNAHGWTLQNGVQTCTNPGVGSNQCGANIALGYTLSFNVVWASGSPSLDQTMGLEIANWQLLGVQVSHSTASFNNVIGDCSGGSGFEICSWGSGWTYSPHYYPSGEALFTPGGGFNAGTYADAQMTSLVDSTISGSANLTAYATYAARQLPVLFEPQAKAIGEVSRKVKSLIGVALNPLGNFMPEYLHY